MKVKSFFKYLALLLFFFSGVQEFYAQTQGRLLSARRQFGDACVAPNNNGKWRVHFLMYPPRKLFISRIIFTSVFSKHP